MVTIGQVRKTKCPAAEHWINDDDILTKFKWHVISSMKMDFLDIIHISFVNFFDLVMVIILNNTLIVYMLQGSGNFFLLALILFFEHEFYFQLLNLKPLHKM